MKTEIYIEKNRKRNIYIICIVISSSSSLQYPGFNKYGKDTQYYELYESSIPIMRRHRSEFCGCSKKHGKNSHIYYRNCRFCSFPKIDDDLKWPKNAAAFQDWVSLIKKKGSLHLHWRLKYTWIKTGKEIYKVHIFWEGHKILQNLHRRFEWHYIRQIYGRDFAKFCCILRIYELYRCK